MMVLPYREVLNRIGRMETVSSSFIKLAAVGQDGHEWCETADKIRPNRFTTTGSGRR
jgi:hypothetical protein